MAVVTRRGFLSGVGAATLGAAATLGYASAFECGYALELTSYRLTPPLWPQDMRLKIAVIADIHACYPFVSEERVGDIVDLANAQRPDLTVLLGDFVCTHRFVTGYVPPGAWAEQLARLEAALGVFAILGNHDWASAAIPTDPPDGSASVRRALAQARIPLLENQSVKLWLDGRPFWIVGLGDQLAYRRGPSGWSSVDDLPGSLKALNDDAPAILLAHEPYIFPEVPERVALTLSGHMHGGQINLPWLGTPFLGGGSRYRKYIYGVYQEGQRTLLLSGGLVTSFVPVRVMRPPEVVIVELGSEPTL
jgi:hypothetical protein